LVPEFATLVAAAIAAPERAQVGEVQIGPANRRRTLLVRLGSDRSAGAETRHFSLVASFDDVTELQAAQRKAAWSDVARRIAHEIKNPLTPIQLSAERLKRRFTREITSDPETFVQCADTIVRHVGDIGRMVDEFSAFARMPQPVMRAEDVGRIAREALVLPRQAHPEIAFASDAIPERGPVAQCDRRLLGQALTNLLRNAIDAVTTRAADSGGGRIAVSVAEQEGEVRIMVADDGAGLPEGDPALLTEPYVTHKAKGTGLGLAIVKKVMEDHGGRLLLEPRIGSADWPGGGAVATLSLPVPTRLPGATRAD
jgi:two-component system nitrogen regulation sensor histidine kinase NtrY